MIAKRSWGWGSSQELDQWDGRETCGRDGVTSPIPSPSRQRQKVNDDVLVAAVHRQVQRTPPLSVGQFRIGTMSYQKFDGFQRSQAAGSVQRRISFTTQAVDVVAINSASQDQFVQLAEILASNSFDQRLTDLLGNVFGWRATAGAAAAVARIPVAAVAVAVVVARWTLVRRGSCVFAPEAAVIAEPPDALGAVEGPLVRRPVVVVAAGRRWRRRGTRRRQPLVAQLRIVDGRVRRIGFGR